MRKKSARQRANRPKAGSATLAPPRGVNLMDNPSGMEPGECLVMTNLIRSEMGTQTRSGYRDWATGLGSGVRSLLGFEGSSSSGDRLFATTQYAIYDCTIADDAPAAVDPTDISSGADKALREVVTAQDYLDAGHIKKVTFGVSSSTSGYGVSSGYTALSGEHYLLYTDEANGYYYYIESTRAWTKATSGTGAGQIDGADPATFAFVMTWKKRVWFIKKDSTLAYYLPVDQYAGTVEAFDFGPQFRHGGHLVGLWSWTIDAGVGIDDMLVAVSSSGDVVVYTGTDPAYFPEIQLRGVWYIGSVPAGRRIATENGGDLLLLSSIGIVPMSKLLTGGIVLPESGATLTRKISPAITRLMQECRTQTGWATQIHPEDSLLVISTPKLEGEYYTQWVMSLADTAWSKLIGLPIHCMCGWAGKLYFGTTGGKVCINDGSSDNRSVDAISIESSVVHGYTDGGAPVTKRLLMARPRFIADGSVPQYAVEGRVDFDRTEVTAVSFVDNTAYGVWGISDWDSVNWGPGELQAGDWRGISGYGIYVSLAMRMSTAGRTVVAGYDLLMDTGGIL